MKKLMFLLVFCTLSISGAWAQKTFKGKVTGPDGLGLPGVNVVEKANPVNGTATDIDGNWTLTVPNENTILEFTAIGMKTIEMAGKDAINLKMESDAQVLDEVMVVAYGTAKKSTFTGSAVVVDNKRLEKIQAADPSKALEGMVPGLSVTSASGRPGEETTLRIRGIGSLNASSSPLIILDGAPYSGEINSINSKDIESINVLKDAASSALYGARGANGVILITTKKGKNGKTQVTFDARIGQNQRGVPEYDVMTAPGTYYKSMWLALKNSQLYSEKPVANPGQWASDNLVKNLGVNIYKTDDNKVVDAKGNLTTAAIKYNDAENFNNWEDELYNPQWRQEYNLSITKGSEKNKIYFSLGYLDDKGFNINSGFERFSSRLSYESKIFDWLKVSAASQLSKTKTSYTASEGNNYSNTFSWTRNIAPIYPVFKHGADGAILKDKYTEELLYEDSLERAYAGGSNLIAQQKMNTDTYDNYYLNQNLRIDIDLPYDLKFNSTATFYGKWWRHTEFLNPLVGDGSAYKGILKKDSNEYSSLNWNQILTWNKDFDSFKLEAMLGHETYSQTGYYLNGEKRNLLDPALMEFVSAATISELKSYSRDYSVEGYFGQVTADFADKYYLSASIRRDGSSIFAPENRWGTFWSLGASWRLKEESFLKDIDALDNLKLRMSYGQQGNDYLYLPNTNPLERAYSPYTNLYEISSDGKNPVYGPKYMGNRDITWEKNINFNVGLEFSIFDGILSGELDFFQRRTNDMLFNLPVPTTTGFSTKPVNIGNMKNTGFEFNLSSRVYNNENVSISLGVNGVTYKNKILNLPEEFKKDGIVSGDLIRKEGGSIYDIYMVKYAGVNPENGDAMYYLFDEKKKEFVAKGSKDYSSDKMHKQFVGSAIPDLEGGFFTNISAYGIDLGLQFSYRIGGYVYDGNYAGLMGAGNAGQNWHNDILNHWTPENKNSDIPRLQVNSQKLISRSDRFLTDASFLSLKNVTLGYNLPNSVLNKIGVESLRVYFAADNVFLLSKRQGLDPRLSIKGTQSYSVNSAIRTISVGLKVTL